MDDLLEDALDARLVIVVVGLFFLGARGFGLGPIADVSRTSPSSRMNVPLLGGGKSDVRLGPIPYFALGPITNVSNSASSSGDSLVLGMNDVDGWLNVRGPEIRDVGEASPSCRVRKRVFGNDIYAVSGQDSVRAPSSFRANLTVFWSTRARG